jgi:cytoskeletal protein RodZ
MFEIGSALREARERKGLSFPQVEEDTKIRARYIRALEEEAFGILPGATYTKGFLRAYADYLGLDGHLFIDEFNSRYHDPRNEDERAIYPKSNSRPRGRQRRETNIVLIVLAAIVAIASMVFLGFNFAGPANVNLPPPPSTSTGSTGSTPSSDTTSHTGTTEKTHSHKTPAKYRIEITAANGSSWLSAHLRSGAGPAAVSVHGTDLSQYLLQQGEVAAILANGPVVIALGAPGSVTVTIAGHAKQLPPGTRFTFTRNGIKRA